MTTAEALRMLSFGLVVLIWLVQLVIYPAFADIAPGRFVAYHAGYTRAVSWVVIPLMLGQAVLIGWRLVERPDRGTVVAAGLVLVAWTATFMLAVPDHGRLQAGGFDEAVIRHLVTRNWIRTVAWTLAWLVLVIA